MGTSLIPPLQKDPFVCDYAEILTRLIANQPGFRLRGEWKMLLSLYDNSEEVGKEILIIRRQKIFRFETEVPVLARL